MMRFMNSRSCEVISNAPSYPFRNCSSQIRLSRSRWLLGSSSSRQRDAHLPAARERADIALHHLLAEAEPRQRLARPAIEGIAVEFLKTALHLAVARDDLVHVIGT